MICPECGGVLRRMYDGGDTSRPVVACLCGYIVGVRGALDQPVESHRKAPESRSEAPQVARGTSRPPHSCDESTEDILAQQIALAGLPTPDRQHRYLPGRRYRADFAWPDRHIALEVEGQVHAIKSQRQRDCERHNLLTMAGWTIYRVSGRMVRDGSALALIEKILEAKA